MKDLKIGMIRNGTVIDHIPAENTFKVVEILDLQNLDKIISIASNLDSKKTGKKGIIKIGGLGLKEKDVKKIGLLAPMATLNIIKNYNVILKEKIDVPEIFENIIQCFNPDCVTNTESIRTRFYLISKDPLLLKCHHCERSMTKDELELL